MRFGNVFSSILRPLDTRYTLLDVVTNPKWQPDPEEISRLLKNAGNQALLGGVFSFGGSGDKSVGYSKASLLGHKNSDPIGLYFMPTGKVKTAMFFQVFCSF